MKTKQNCRNTRKSLFTVLALVLVATMAIGGTLAYLYASQAGDTAVVNTFLAAGDGSIIDPVNPVDPTDPDDPEPTPTPVDPADPTQTVDLMDGFYLIESESTLTSAADAYEIASGAADVLANDYDSVVAGMTIAKDPNLTVNIVESVGAYIFVKVTDTTNGNLSYTIDSSNWTEVTGVTLEIGETLYLYQGAALVGTSDVELTHVSILSGDTVTAADSLTDIDDSDSTVQLGELTFEAYVCQSAGFDTAAEAYAACFQSN